jgi:hypothetical protein
LIVPAVLAVGGYLFTRSENEATRAATEQRANNEALQAYLDQMSQMKAAIDKPLSKLKPDDPLGMVVEARTQALLPRLDAQSKRHVVKFLSKTELIQSSYMKVLMEKLKESIDREERLEKEGKNED